MVMKTLLKWWADGLIRTIDAIVRGEEVIMAHHNTVIKPEDHVILFLTDKKQITAVEKLFQVGFMFL